MQQRANHHYSVKEAAAFLRIGSNTLFKKLREEGVFSNKNIARGDLVRAGYFAVELRTFERKTDMYAIKQPYWVSLVTVEGLQFIQDLITRSNKEKENERTGIHTVVSNPH